MKATIGVDYGTNSVRAILVDIANGNELSSSVFNYPTGTQGVILDEKDPHLARQNPADYIVGLETTIKQAIADAKKNYSLDTNNIIGIGIDTTGSSPIPVDSTNTPFACLEKWKDNPNAQCWLWKDHTSVAEASRITAAAARFRPHYIAKCGNTYSSEWFWAKIWHCLNTDPDVFHAAHSWVELSDFIPALLCGIDKPENIRRNVCAAGHKALYAQDWNGLPDKEFLELLDPCLASLRDRLYDTAYDASHTAGQLCSEWAQRLGLPQGIPIAMGAMDVHYGAIGCGINEGTLVKVIGTSTCDCLVMPTSHNLPDIPGICGIVNGSILPGHFGIEAGQSAVGDIFKWWVEYICKGDESTHIKLTKEASEMRPGSSGLLALDWNNGNRTILVDQLLTGLILGQTLYTTQAEVYRALIEATAFGARAIIERIKEYGVPVNRIICAGGIAEKNPLLMQIYADITGCEMRVAGSSQACALGAAISAAVAAGAHKNFPSAQKAMTSLKDVIYRPIPAHSAIYNEIYALYLQVHDAFGGVEPNSNLSNVMKKLIEIRQRS